MQTKTFLAVSLMLLSCDGGDKPATTEPVADNSVKNNSGYTIMYSSAFQVDPPANAEKILGLYKDFDNNTLDNSMSLFADSLNIVFGDGTVINGLRDSVMGQVKSFRNNYSSVKNNVHAVFGARATDKNENWVFVWAREVHTDKTGKTDSVELQENWLLDKNGKIRTLFQYQQSIQPTPPQN
jgi:hypothetical protein